MSGATLASLLGQMTQDKEVLNGWDAVLSVTEAAIDGFLQKQFAALTGETGRMTMTRVFCGPALHDPGGTYCVVTEFSFTLGAPRFAFTGGSNTITVTQRLVAGSTRSGTMPVGPGFEPSGCGCTADDPRVTWGPRAGIDLGADPAVSAAVPLAMVGGVVDVGTRTVALVMADGAFTMLNLVLQGVAAPALAEQVRGWFLEHEVRYQLATLDFSGAGTIPALTPTGFRFAVLRTDGGHLLVQLLIVTDGREGAGPPLVGEPVPVEDGYSCSLMVSSRILFADILCAGFNAAGKPFKLYPRCRDAAAGYTASIAPEVRLEVSFSYGSCCDKTHVHYTTHIGGTYSGSATEGFQLFRTSTPSGNIGNTITIRANNPVGLTGSGAGQLIRIDPQTPSVEVTGGDSGTLNDRLRDILTNDYGTAMAGISFAPVSVFALRTMLFPASMIRMSVVQAPTDLLVVGTFEPA